MKEHLMKNRKKVTAIVGTYRKGGIIDTTVDAIIAAASEEGAEVRKIYLMDANIEFCMNCRDCTQEPGQNRGQCRVADDMSAILDEIEAADSIVLGSPMNFGTVTALMKRFIERLVCFAYWPWGTNAPKSRSNNKTKTAVLVASSMAPSWMARPTTKMVALLKQAASLLGAKTIGVLYVGMAAREEKQQISAKIRNKARVLGKKLVADTGTQRAAGP
jgi:multimeric flavodoxin WrbA